jgi:hypothetical protein
MESPAGYAFHTGKIVISNHLQEETRFPDAAVSGGPGDQASDNVLIARGGEGHLPFGVQEVDSADAGQFDSADANFLAGFAGRLGIAIERQHADAELQSALDHLSRTSPASFAVSCRKPRPSTNSIANSEAWRFRRTRRFPLASLSTSLLPTRPNMLTPMDPAKSMSRGNSAAQCYMSSSASRSGPPEGVDIDQPRAQLAQAVRGRGPPIKIIATSGRYVVRDGDLPSGGAFLKKPYSPAQISSALLDLTAQA